MADMIAGNEKWFDNLERVRGIIRDRFSQAHHMLQVREAKLIVELQELEHEHRERKDRYAEEMEQLSNSKEHLLATLKGNNTHFILQQSIAPLDARMQDLKSDLQLYVRKLENIQVEWGEELREGTDVVGTLVEREPAKVPDYKDKDLPVLVGGKHNRKSTVAGQFRFPRGITIDKQTNQVYICDTGNNRVQVFSESLEFIFMFSEKMNGPIGICVDEEKVYVTQYYAHSLNVYSIHGKLLRKVGSQGMGKLQFNNPCGIAISPQDKNIYVCDNDNDRVLCFKENLTLDSSISDIFGPRDIQLTRDEIIVLNGMNPCLHIYDYTYHLLREMVSCGEGNQLNTSHYFAVDSESNIFLTDYNSHCVLIWDKRGVLLHKFSQEGNGRGDVIEPTGIALDRKGRILVVSENAENCVQLF